MTDTQDRLEERLTKALDDAGKAPTTGDAYLILRNAVRAALRQSQDIEAAARERASFIAYIWTATGKNHLRPVSDLFAEDDPIVADVERLSVDPTALAPKAEEAPR